jgi:hypothetical protein
MEKISGILPERPRIRAESEPLPPVRPGAPSFGRPEGSTEIRDRVTLSSTKNIGPQEFQNYKNPKEAKHVKIVEDLNRKFFMNPTKEPEITKQEFAKSEGVFPEGPVRSEPSMPPARARVSPSDVNPFDDYA